MCGIAGYFRAVPDQPADALRRAAQQLRHRGPDSSGTWLDETAGVGLASTRLAILDPSPDGAQPMASPDGRFVLVHNGEIYNHRQLRVELERDGAAPDWRGGSDTETMLAAFRRWGVRGALDRFSGMFAFAVWDRQERTLTLARDRFGIKPLYWTPGPAGVLFASELKAIAVLRRERPTIDGEALAQFLRFDCVPAPRTIFRDVHKLPAGHVVTVRDGGLAQPECWWDLRRFVDECVRNRESCDRHEAVQRVEAALAAAVSRHLLSDVPLGAFLSGGIDSSIVVALMQAASPRPVRTFTVGFPGTPVDEAGYAAQVARHLGTEHRQIDVTEADAAALIPQLPDIYDEPFADPSQIPGCLIARATRAHVTVALSGDGGDELFGGYNRHALADRVLRPLLCLPPAMRRALAGAINGLRPATWDRWCATIPVLGRLPQPADKLSKLAEVLAADGEHDAYLRLLSRWKPAAGIVAADAAGQEPAAWQSAPPLESFAEVMQLLDTLFYLPDDVLTKVDRATMAASLECRVPFLDLEVADAAWRLPTRFKMRGVNGKWILRRMLRRYLPPALIERPKGGFSVPLDRWLRGALRDWAETLLAEHALARHGLLNAAPIRARWQEHLAGRRNHAHQLWNVLMFQCWHERWAG